jgi:hypothetical protein
MAEKKEKYSEEREKNYPMSTRVAKMGDAAVEDMMDVKFDTAHNARESVGKAAKGLGRYGLAAGMYAPAIAADVGSRIKDKVMGTKQQNEEATERMRKMDEKNPDSAQAKTNKALGMKKGGKVSSASSRADGCATKGKTKGRMV